MSFSWGKSGAAAAGTLQDLLARRFQEQMEAQKLAQQERYQGALIAEMQDRTTRQREQDALAEQERQRKNFLDNTAPDARMDPEAAEKARGLGLGTLITQKPADEGFGIFNPGEKPMGPGIGPMQDMEYPQEPTAAGDIFRGTPEYLRAKEEDRIRKEAELRGRRERELEKDETREWREKDREDRQVAEAARQADALAAREAQVRIAADARREATANRAAVTAEIAANKQAEKDRLEAQKDQSAQAGRDFAVKSIDELLKDPTKLDSIIGMVYGRIPSNYLGPIDTDTLAQLDQVKALMALEGRQKLKGSGAISDFESKMLEKAATKINRAGTLDTMVKELETLRSQLSGPAPGTRAYADMLRTSPPANPKKGDTFNGFTWDGTGWTK